MNRCSVIQKPIILSMHFMTLSLDHVCHGLLAVTDGGSQLVMVNGNRFSGNRI